ncbi:MAG: hypothetical protein Q9172_006995 [Xanthocarpia lactea]
MSSNTTADACMSDGLADEWGFWAAFHRSGGTASEYGATADSLDEHLYLLQQRAEQLQRFAEKATDTRIRPFARHWADQVNALVTLWSDRWIATKCESREELIMESVVIRASLEKARRSIINREELERSRDQEGC